MDRRELAAQYFLQGQNCAQSVAMAYADLLGMDVQSAARLASPFGGGMGRMREVCGAVSGMLMVLGVLYGYDKPDDVAKQALYQQVQDLAGSFREQVGTIYCRDILDNPPSDPNPSPRTAAYYAERPCARMVMIAAGLMEDFINSHPMN